MERNGNKLITKGAPIGVSAINPRPCYGLVTFNLGPWALPDKLRKGGFKTLDTIDGNIKRGLFAIDYIQRIPFNRIGTYVAAKRAIGAYSRLTHGNPFRQCKGGRK